MYQAARIIWNDFGLDEQDGYPLLEEYNATKCVPPWSDQEVAHKWASAVGNRPGAEGRGHRLQENSRNWTNSARPTRASGDILSPDDPDSGDEPQNPMDDPERCPDRPPKEWGEDWADPNRLARLYVDFDQLTRDQKLKLRNWRDEYYEWDEVKWRKSPAGEMTAKLTCHVNRIAEWDYPARDWIARQNDKDAPARMKASTNLTANVRQNLASQTFLRDAGVEQPFWADGVTGMPPADEVIVAPNGLFTLPDIAAGKPPFSPPTPDLFSCHALTFPVPEKRERPELWLECLGQWFSGDAASIAGLQEWMGYVLTANMSIHKILMLVGPRRSGKGTIMQVTKSLVGDANTVSTTMRKMGKDFSLQPLLGKRLAVIPDCRVDSKTDVAAAVENMLAISGGDPLGVNRKHLEELASVQLKTRIAVASNEIPHLPDSSGAMSGRFHILHTPNSWFGKEDTGLLDRLKQELPCIIGWAADGWVRLVSQGMAFTANEMAENHQRMMTDLASPIREFISGHCEVRPDFEVDSQMLYQAWCEWHAERNMKRPTDNMFGRDLLSVIPKLKQTQPRRPDGTRPRVYVGVRLKTRDEWCDSV